MDFGDAIIFNLSANILWQKKNHPPDWEDGLPSGCYQLPSAALPASGIEVISSISMHGIFVKWLQRVGLNP
jgi:hypothetical protein